MVQSKAKVHDREVPDAIRLCCMDKNDSKSEESVESRGRVSATTILSTIGEFSAASL